MNKNKSGHGGVNIGTSLILVTFVLLSLVTFAVLSLSTAIADETLSQKAALHTTEYYNASNLANQKLADLADRLLDLAGKATSQEDFYRSVGQSDFEALNVTVISTKEIPQLRFEEPINDHQTLLVTLEAVYPSSDDGRTFQIIEWETINTVEIDEDMPIMKKNGLLNQGGD